ncbi:MAG: pentapeptide repeat-containing protein, partial [Pseudomonadota bacterium]
MTLYAPPPQPEPDHGIGHIAEINQNARAAWFGLLALLVFVGVTLLGHKDADFFAFGASTQLPLVGVSVPPEAFFWTAPILTAALYCYLHLYLINLWGALANAPARLDGKPLADRVPPTMITTAALIYRDMQRGDRCVADRPLRIATLVITFLLVWGFGWIVLALLWVRSLPLHHEWMSLLIGLCLYLSLEFGRINLTVARRLLTDPATRIVTRFVPMRTGASLGLLIIISTASWATTEGDPFGESWLYPADLEEAELTVRPADWKDRETWMEDYEIVWSKNTRIPFDFETKVTDTKQFKDNAFPRRKAAVDALKNKSFRGADLRNARMTLTFLSGADLRGARLEGANLFRARLEGADLRWARLEGADLGGARLEGADLGWARLEGADLGGADLKSTDLRDWS